MNCDKSKRGSVVLETALVLPIFIFLFLFVFSFIPVFSTRNQMSHSLIQATKSLAMDPYLNEVYTMMGDTGTGSSFWTDLDSAMSDAFRTIAYGNSNYSHKYNWYAADSNVTVVENRFIGYMGGDRDTTDEYLKTLRVDNGIDGVSFDYYVNNGVLYVKMNYRINYLFDFGGLGGVDVEHVSAAKMWGYSGASGDTTSFDPPA